ncbi:hypothetical protein ACA910_022751 [Epithemia clementina (nom. ined.)]
MDLGYTLEQFANDAEQELLGEWNNSRGNPNYPLMSSLVTSIEGKSEKKQLAWDAAMQWKNVVTENEQRFVLWLDGNALVRSYLNAAERINHYVLESRRRQHDGQQAMVQSQSHEAAAAKELYDSLINMPSENWRCLIVFLDPPPPMSLQHDFFPPSWEEQRTCRRNSHGHVSPFLQWRSSAL